MQQQGPWSLGHPRDFLGSLWESLGSPLASLVHPRDPPETSRDSSGWSLEVSGGPSGLPWEVPWRIGVVPGGNMMFLWPPFGAPSTIDQIEAFQKLGIVNSI